MPLQRLDIAPGLRTDVTAYTNQNGWQATQWVRFFAGHPRSMGGWALRYPAVIDKNVSAEYAEIHTAFTMVTPVGTTYTALGMPTRVVVLVEEPGAAATLVDVTPQTGTTLTLAATGTFTPTNCSTSASSSDVGFTRSIHTTRSKLATGSTQGTRCPASAQKYRIIPSPRR